MITLCVPACNFSFAPVIHSNNCVSSLVACLTLRGAGTRNATGLIDVPVALSRVETLLEGAMVASKPGAGGGGSINASEVR